MKTPRELFRLYTSDQIIERMFDIYSIFDDNIYLFYKYQSSISYALKVPKSDKHCVIELYKLNNFITYGAHLIYEDDPVPYSLTSQWGEFMDQEILFDKGLKQNSLGFLIRRCINLRDLDVVAIILWEMTFYGYTPEIIEKTLDQYYSRLNL